MIEDEAVVKETKPSRSWLWSSPIFLSLVIGLLLTIFTTAIVDINLSSQGYLPANDDVNRYFDTCVGEGFGSGTPLIHVDERGFPLSHITVSKIPVCDNLIELKRVTHRSVDIGAIGANVLFWSILSYMTMRKIRRRIKN